MFLSARIDIRTRHLKNVLREEQEAKGLLGNKIHENMLQTLGEERYFDSFFPKLKQHFHDTRFPSDDAWLTPPLATWAASSFKKKKKHCALLFIVFQQSYQGNVLPGFTAFPNKFSIDLVE